MTNEELAIFNQMKVSPSQPSSIHDTVLSIVTTFVQPGNPIACVSSSSQQWLIDFRATGHMLGNMSLFTKYLPYNMRGSLGSN